jgi:EAL domain-containing protein (putative c-di-GMP-specific phosphodiesterase class I)
MTKQRTLSRARRNAKALRSTSQETAERRDRESLFERALESLWIAVQPIVHVDDASVFGYEALVRNREPGVPHPGVLFDLAEEHGCLRQLGRTIRARVADIIQSGNTSWVFFVNLHPFDLNDPELMSVAAPLSGVAERVILEITERASLEDIPNIAGCVAELRSLGYQIAIDDLGSGYSGLSSFARLEPEIVKLDMSLVRNVERSQTQQRLIASMTTLSHDLGTRVVAEGIETQAELETVRRLNVDYLQGYYFAKPGPPFPPLNKRTKKTPSQVKKRSVG